MFGLRKRKRSLANDALTFRERVDAFWPWFESRAERYYEAIEAGKCESLLEDVSGFMDHTLPHLSWVFGPGESGGHSFTVSGEGIVVKQVLAARWLEDAGEYPGWTFYCSRQPCGPDRLDSIAISVGPNDAVDAANFLIATLADDERQKFDVVAWHPALTKVPESDHMTILFLLLDEALGEFGTDQWLGRIELRPFDRESPPDASSRVQSLSELPAFVEQAHRYHGWEKLSPLRAYSGYQAQELTDGPRGDTIAGTTLIPNTVIEYIHRGGSLESNDLQGTGADLLYVRFSSENLPQGQEADTRGNIEDALDEALMAAGSGRTLGGGCGTEQSYIDLITFDGPRSRQIIEDVLGTLHLRGNTAIESF